MGPGVHCGQCARVGVSQCARVGVSQCARVGVHNVHVFWISQCARVGVSCFYINIKDWVYDRLSHTNIKDWAHEGGSLTQKAGPG